LWWWHRLFIYADDRLHEKRLIKANGEDKKSELIQNDQEKNGSWSHLNIQGCHLRTVTQVFWQTHQGIVLCLATNI
jgi:hypothetical protein